MKLSRRNLAVFVRILVLTMVASTLAWDLAERLLASFGPALSLSIGPVGFDVGVLSVWIAVNPGTAVGVWAGHRLFTKLG